MHVIVPCCTGRLGTEEPFNFFRVTNTSCSIKRCKQEKVEGREESTRNGEEKKECLESLDGQLALYTSLSDWGLQ